MDDLLEFAEFISIENTWPFHLVLYSIGLIVTLVAISRNKKKKQVEKEKELNEIDEIS